MSMSKRAFERWQEQQQGKEDQKATLGCAGRPGGTPRRGRWSSDATDAGPIPDAGEHQGCDDG